MKPRMNESCEKKFPFPPKNVGVYVFIIFFFTHDTFLSGPLVSSPSHPLGRPKALSPERDVLISRLGRCRFRCCPTSVRAASALGTVHLIDIECRAQTARQRKPRTSHRTWFLMTVVIRDARLRK